MTMNYVVQQKTLGLSECERLCGTGSRNTEDLAFRSGLLTMPGGAMRASVSVGINMLVHAIGAAQGLEPHAVNSWLPGLRNEALLTLGQETDNWWFDGTAADSREFFASLYGRPEDIRPRIARLLQCCLATTTRQLRFHTGSDIEFLSPSQFELGNDGRVPRFSIDAHDLAHRIQAVCGRQLFTVRTRADY